MSAVTQIGKISFGDSGVHFLSVPFTFTDNLNNSWTIDAQNKHNLNCKGLKRVSVVVYRLGPKIDRHLRSPLL